MTDLPRRRRPADWGQPPSSDEQSERRRAGFLFLLGGLNADRHSPREISGEVDFGNWKTDGGRARLSWVSTPVWFGGGIVYVDHPRGGLRPVACFDSPDAIRARLESLDPENPDHLAVALDWVKAEGTPIPGQ